MKILSRLNELQYATRKQLQIIENLGGDRNAHRILYQMEKDKLLLSHRREQKIYYLSNKGKELVGSSNEVLSGRMIDHALMRNDFYIMLGMPDGWEKEKQFIINKGKENEETIIFDAMYKFQGEFYLIEVDNTQPLKNNYEKINKFPKISKLVFQAHKHTPTYMYYTTTEARRQKLEDYIKRKGIKGAVYLHA